MHVIEIENVDKQVICLLFLEILILDDEQDICQKVTDKRNWTVLSIVDIGQSPGKT